MWRVERLQLLCMSVFLWLSQCDISGRRIVTLWKIDVTIVTLCNSVCTRDSYVKLYMVSFATLSRFDNYVTVILVALTILSYCNYYMTVKFSNYVARSRLDCYMTEHVVASMTLSQCGCYMTAQFITFVTMSHSDRIKRCISLRLRRCYIMNIMWWLYLSIL